MKKLIKLGMITGLAFASGAIANTLDLNLDGGVAFSQLSNNTTVSPTTGLTNSYTANETVQTGSFFALGPEYVLDHLTSTPFKLGLGVSAYYVNLGNISGTETPGSNMGFTDKLNYSMQADSAGLLFEPRFIYTAHRFQPYALAGAGYAWNTLKNFDETTPAGSGAAPSNPYRSHTEGSFAYEFGAGVQYPLMVKPKTDLLLRFEYRYLNLGNAELGPASGQTTNERLASKNTFTNIVNVGLSYQF